MSDAYVVIGRPDCPWCVKAQKELEVSNLSYRYKNLKWEPWLRNLCIEAGITTVPQVFTPEGERIGGYEALVQHLLEK